MPLKQERPVQLLTELLCLLDDKVSRDHALTIGLPNKVGIFAGTEGTILTIRNEATDYVNLQIDSVKNVVHYYYLPRTRGMDIEFIPSNAQYSFPFERIKVLAALIIEDLTTV